MEKTAKSIIKEGVELITKQLREKDVNLYELEETIFQAFQPLQKEVFERTASSLSSEETGKCKHCSAPVSELSSEGIRKKKLLSRFGKITLERQYYFCKRCKKHSYCNNKRKETILYGRLSPRFTEIVCMEAKDMPFHTASDRIRRNFAVEVSADTIRRAAEFVGTQEFEKAGKELSGQDYLDCEQSNSPEQICIEIDGSNVNTREESWKECKLGIVYDQKDAKQTGEKGRVSIQAKSLAGALAKGYEEFTLRLKRLLVETGALGAKEHILISDGSLWIEKVFQAIIPNGVMILDWYHACEHLWACANKIYGDSAQAECWVAFYKKLLKHGCVDYMLERLLEKAETVKKQHQTPIRELYSYFKTRHKRLRYDLFLQKGYPIGSGAIESAHKYCVQSRLKQAGMKWSIKNANAIIQLRNTYLSGNWDNIWTKAA